MRIERDDHRRGSDLRSFTPQQIEHRAMPQMASIEYARSNGQRTAKWSEIFDAFGDDHKALRVRTGEGNTYTTRKPSALRRAIAAVRPPSRTMRTVPSVRIALFA